ncbi:PAS domain S-box protein [Ideonella sp. YS5]|uniref:PAS domain S-box protein n=1 Tax=Ideonella sp. YS5 TaxID=3453714 RepID=UPI003EEB1AE1
MKPARTFLGRLLLLVGVVTLPWVVALSYEIEHDRRAAEQAALESMRQRSQLLAQEAARMLQRGRQLLDFLAARPEILQDDRSACRSLLTGLVRIEPLLANAGYADADGSVRCTTVESASVPTSVARTQAFQAARGSPQVRLGPVRPSVVNGHPVLPILRGVAGPGGEDRGVLVLMLDLQAWSDSWARHLLAEGGTLTLQDAAGTVLGRYPDPPKWIGQRLPEQPASAGRDLPADIRLATGLDGVRRFYALTPVSDWPLTAVAGISEEAVVAPARRNALRAALALALLTALVGWLAWRLSRRLVAPLEHLAATARAVAQGARAARADEALPGEFSAVAGEFNRMLDSRDQAQARLSESERRFREMLDTVELFAVAADVDGRITYCNDFFLKRTGWTLQELAGADYGERCVPPERRRDRDSWRHALREGQLPAHAEAAILTRQGERRLVRWSSTMLRDEQGVVIGRASIGEDVTDQRRAEQQVLRLSGFLQALSRTQRAIIHRYPRDELLREACDACVDAGQARMASAWLRQAGEGSESLVSVAWAGPAERLFGRLPMSRSLADPGLADTLTGHALGEGLWGISSDLLNDPLAADWRDQATTAGVLAQAVFPLRCAGEVIGVLLLHVDEADWFDDALVKLLHQLTDELAFALDNLQREQARVAAEQRAAVDHRRFKSIFEASPMGIAVRTLGDGRLLDLNPVFARRVGRPREELIGKSLFDLGLGMTIEDHRRLMSAMRSDARLTDFEVRVRDAAGVERVLLFNGELIDYDGRPALLTISHDITERRHAEQALLSREQQLAGIVETAMDAIITIDASQTVVMFNRAAAEMFGLPAEQALGHHLDEFVPAELLERHREGLRAFIASGRERVAIGHERTLYGVRANGERFAFEAAVSRQGEGPRLTMTAVIRDLTDRLAAEAAREARIVAEAASHAKTEFLSRMSHELRTPLNAMLGFAQLLSDDPREPLSARQRRHLELTREAGWHLLALIDDVLDVSRIEAGQLEMQFKPVPLKPLIDSALSVAATLAARHRIHLRGPAPELLAGPLAVRADATRLRQVVLNLLSNGCKYNRPGGWVEVQVHLADEGETVCVEVADNGVGMNGEQMAHLFEPFNRLGREGGVIEGTGIGLHLTRQLVLKMGGAIEAHSDPGEGTRMRVRLPRARMDTITAPSGAGERSAASGPQAPAATAESALAGDILYVEDNPVNLLLVEQFLRRWPDVRLHSADTGGAGLARMRDERFDLVLLDMQLPDMHGTELLQHLASERLLAYAPVVALSASAMPEAVDAALSAGAVEYWTKPLNLARLDADLRRFLKVAA